MDKRALREAALRLSLEQPGDTEQLRQQRMVDISLLAQSRQSPARVLGEWILDLKTDDA